MDKSALCYVISTEISFLPRKTTSPPIDSIALSTPFPYTKTMTNVINDTTTVKNQYTSSANLNTRISIHDKYSTNKMGFSNWIYSNYKIEKGMRVLELGCGTGSMWVGKSAQIENCSKLVLSDFSEGMIETARQNLTAYNKIEYSVIDIQNIPLEDDSFDVVIANMMLYHVPDIQKGLSEVKRVLKTDGTFYAATYGEHGIIQYLASLLNDFGITDTTNKNFTLQNGAAILSQKFSQVHRFDYKDSLAVTNLDDIIDYIFSLSNMTSFNNLPRDEIKKVLQKHVVNGVLNVPKEYGMFVCKI